MVSRCDGLASKRSNLQLRSRVLQAIRDHFVERGFLEVQTPLLTTEPAPEAHIEPMAVDGGRFLVTSPELYMKRMLAAGYRRLFQISPVFRNGERGRRHLPEFTLLEWYRTGADYRLARKDCEELVKNVCRATGRWPGWNYAGKWLQADSAWEDLTVAEAFRRFAGWVPEADVDQERFDRDLVERVEPNLGFPVPCTLSDYPANQAALARLKEGDPSVAERFEVYWAGIELANGFSELTDPREQRSRFQAVMDLRKRAVQKPLPMPEAFLASLDRLPPCTGVALGVDRLVMLLADATTLDEVVAFAPPS